MTQPDDPVVESSRDTGVKEPAIPGPFLPAIKTTVTSVDPIPETRFFVVEDEASSPSGDVLAAAIIPPPPLNLISQRKSENPVASDVGNTFPWEVPLISVGAILLGASTITMIIKAGGWGFLRGIFVSD